MQTENSGSSQNKKQEDTKKMSDGESRIGTDLGGNEYTAAFILYCQKTLDNFRRVYASDADASFGLGFGSVASAGLASSSTAGTSSKMGSEPQKDKFELAQDYQLQSSDDEEREALRELSEQFEQMLKARAEFEDNDLELDEDDETDADDEEREALRELSEQFEQMLKARAEFEDNDLELDEDDEAKGESDKEKESLEEFFEQFEKMFEAKSEYKDNELKLEKDDKKTDNSYKEKEALEEFFEQFEQMLKSETEPGNKPPKLEQVAESQSNSYKGKEALKELLGQFEQMLNNDTNPNSNDLALEPYDRSQTNGHKEEEGLKEFLEQSKETEKKSRGDDASSREVSRPEAHREEKSQSNVTEPSTQSSNNGPNDAEVDEALSGVGEVVKSAKENLGIVEAFWEESESERAKLLAKARITQEDFEQIVTCTGAYLYDVKDCLEGWGDLSMLPEIYEQLLLANNELTEIFEKMYGKSMIEVLGKGKEEDDEEDDDWELDDDDWELDDDDDD